MSEEELSISIWQNAEEEMEKGLQTADLFLNKNYLIDLSKCEPVAMKASQKSFSYLSMFQVVKLVRNPDEDICDKLVSVYSAINNLGSSAILTIASDKNEIKFYIGTRDTSQPDVAKSILQKSLRGNFPGIELKDSQPDEVEAVLERRIPGEYKGMSISSVSIVPSERSNDKKAFVQGIEKFIDAMAGEDYTAVFISTPIDKKTLQEKKRGYENLYSTLSQCAQLSVAYGESESLSIADGISSNFSRAVNDGVSDTISSNTGASVTKSRGRSSGSSFGVGFWSTNSGTNHSTANASYSGTSQSSAKSYSQSQTTGTGTSSTKTSTGTTTKTFTLNRHNKTVERLLERIESQLKRIENCESYGLWDSACYFVSPRQETSLIAANTFKAIVTGHATGIENSFVNTWDASSQSSKRSLAVMEYLRYGLHPYFKYIPFEAQNGFSEQQVSAASMVSGAELPLLMNFPRKSVSGVVSIESAEFGREVLYKRRPKDLRTLKIGSVLHMGEVSPENHVALDIDHLTSHCFITGSTGSGKSNTVYKIIEELVKPKNNIKVLIIEPAKGEYKTALSAIAGLNIFSTNPAYFELLRINPFEFHQSIHVLEHLDRLIEIFSACWPMYAAMPAILKNAFERAYVAHGWDLNSSVRINVGNSRFPTFSDVLTALSEVINESEYSSETKGDYIGSLSTRVSSLTNGLIGQIFVNEAIADEVLFDQNTIVDISRIGSMETKSLIMGILVLKLSEYRLSTSSGPNQKLKHVTIIEEAHNLLKRVNTQQSQEVANLQGKSVEMISASISEMRTYGEGFIIVDQSPSAVDISAIKNTGTKIIMNLPEINDCQAIGGAVSLSADQIAEISKLDTGSAIVYDNRWTEPVLTQVDLVDNALGLGKTRENDRKQELALKGCIVEELITQYESRTFNMAWLNSSINASQATNAVKARITNRLLAYQSMDKTDQEVEAFDQLLFELLECHNLFQMHERKLPPIVKSKKAVTNRIREMSRNWRACIIRGLEQYCTLESETIKLKLFEKLLLHTISISKIKYRYLIALSCLQQ